jgi:acetyl esterase/lipase
MDTFGPSLAGTHVIPVDTRTSDGRRVVGEWVYGAGVQRDHADTAIYFVHGSGYGAEMLAADAIALADGIRSAGGTCELEVWPDQVHDFQALPRLTPEARPAISRIAGFITQVLRDKTIQEAAG